MADYKKVVETTAKIYMRELSNRVAVAARADRAKVISDNAAARLVDLDVSILRYKEWLEFNADVETLARISR